MRLNGLVLDTGGRASLSKQQLKCKSAVYVLGEACYLLSISRRPQLINGLVFHSTYHPAVHSYLSTGLHLNMSGRDKGVERPVRTQGSVRSERTQRWCFSDTVRLWEWDDIAPCSLVVPCAWSGALLTTQLVGKSLCILHSP